MKAKTDGEGSTLNDHQPMVPDRSISEEPRAPLLETVGVPVSTIPSMARSTIPGATNFEGMSAHLLVPIVDPKSMELISMVPHTDPSMIPQAAPLKTTQIVPFVDQSRFPPLSPSNSFEMFPEMFLQMCPPLSQETVFRRPPRTALPMPPTTMASPIPSPIMTPSMSCSSVSSNNSIDGLFSESPQSVHQSQ